MSIRDLVMDFKYILCLTIIRPIFNMTFKQYIISCEYAHFIYVFFLKKKNHPDPSVLVSLAPNVTMKSERNITNIVLALA